MMLTEFRRETLLRDAPAQRPGEAIGNRVTGPRLFDINMPDDLTTMNSDEAFQVFLESSAQRLIARKRWRSTGTEADRKAASESKAVMRAAWRHFRRIRDSEAEVQAAWDWPGRKPPPMTSILVYETETEAGDAD